MRRRIYVDPEGPLEDVTASPSRYDLDQEPAEPPRWCRTYVLHDEALWARYRTALAELSRVEREVTAALKYEPWDDVEVALARRANDALDHGRDSKESMDVVDECERLAIEHAAKFEACPDRCPYIVPHRHVKP